MTGLRLMLTRLAQRESYRSRGRCHCPLCWLAERQARKGIGMPVRHPERITRELSPALEEQLADLADELWPEDEWTRITADTWRHES